MVFDPEAAAHLKPWLVRTLEPICDAEPGALADYILALLKHNVPESEMRQELAVQLDEFLEKECSSFIDTLFTVIRTKSYMPYSAAEPSPASFPSKSLDNGIPIPLDALLPSSSSDRTRKRSDVDDERDGRPPAKGPRLNNDTQFSRYGNGGGDGRMGPQSSGGWSRPQGGNGMAMGMGAYAGQLTAMGMNGMNGMNGMVGMGGMMNGRRPQGYQPPDQKRGICRDYHNNGYCSRGAMCKYSHGEDAVVPGQLFPGMPFIPMFPGNGNGMPFMQGAAYDPHESRMDMRPTGGRQHQRAPLLPRIQQEDGSRVMHPINASGELPVIQDLTPVIPPENPAAEPIPSSDVTMQQPVPAIPSAHMTVGYNPNLATGMNGNAYPSTNTPVETDNTPRTHMPGSRPPTLGRGQFRGGAPNSGRGRGTFGGEVHNFRPEKRNDKTLVVEKIPEDKLSLEGVNTWFKRFGTVTNVAIDAANAKALVSFSNHEDAHAAWKSEDAVFGNRFVKVFWHRPMEGYGQVGARMLAASAPLVANMSGASSAPAATTTTTTPSAISTSTVATSTPRKASTTSGASATLSALAAKQQLLEQTIAEQKTLMASLSTASAEEKKEIMARLRKLSEEMTKLTSSTHTVAVAVSSSSSNPPIVAAAKKPADKMTEHERKERERLDKELELHGAEEQQAESGEDLKAKLERLKAEAMSLGLDSALPTGSGGYRGYRGRGRGGGRGGYFRGAVMRGGPPRASMKLDNRPKKLLVKGVGEDHLQTLRDWYETTGQLESVEPAESSAYIVSFKSRSAAEMGLAKGMNIPIIGPVQISWSTGKESTSTTTPTQTTKLLAVEPTNGIMSSAPQTPDLHHSHLQEEEIVASGWGGDDEEDGMGLL